MSHWLKRGRNRKLLWIRHWQNPLLWERPKLLTKMSWKTGQHKASHHFPRSYLCLSQRAHGGALQSLCIWLLWRVLMPVGDVRWGFPFLVVSQRTIVEDLMWRSAEMLRSQTFLLRVTMRCLFFLLCYIRSSLHVNVLSGCLFDEPVICTESIFAFKLNIFRKRCSFWHFTQVHLVPWRKLTMKSHSASSDCIGIILC